MFQRLETGAVTDAMVQLGWEAGWRGLSHLSKNESVRPRGYCPVLNRGPASGANRPVPAGIYVLSRDVLVWNVPHRGNICGEKYYALSRQP